MPAAPRPLPATPLTVLRVDGATATVAADFVATEEPLEIQLAYENRGQRVARSLSVTMRTPGHDRELAAGFLFAEGVVRAADDLAEISAAPETPNLVRVTLRSGLKFDARKLDRHFPTTSSCGVCGKTSLAALRATLPAPLPLDTPLLAPDAIHRLPAALRPAQSVFDQTGGLHAAALFDPTGKLLALREDVGRHNAVDKLIGAQLLAGRLPLSSDILFVSGRASFELMQKALMAGIPVLAAVGAPSSLAVDLAREHGATLLGFVRGGRFNIYAGASRLRLAPETTAAISIRAAPTPPPSSAIERSALSVER